MITLTKLEAEVLLGAVLFTRAYQPNLSAGVDQSLGRLEDRLLAEAIAASQSEAMEPVETARAA